MEFVLHFLSNFLFSNMHVSILTLYIETQWLKNSVAKHCSLLVLTQVQDPFVSTVIRIDIICMILDPVNLCINVDTYTNWHTIDDEFGVSFIMAYNESLTINHTFFMVSLTDTVIGMVSLPFVNVSMNSHCPLGFNLTNKNTCDCIDILYYHGYSYM